MERMGSTFLLALLLANTVFCGNPVYAQSTEAMTECFEKWEGSKPLAETYLGVERDGRTYIQAAKGDFGLSDKARPFLDYRARAEMTTLCDGHHAVISERVSWGKFQTYLRGQIFDGGLNPLMKQFRVTDSDEVQLNPSVGRLYDGNFVVTWTTRTDRSSDIRARIFDESGEPRGHPFDVTSSPKWHGRATVYGLPDGGFAVVWGSVDATARIRTSTYVRMFTKDGSSRTAEVLVGKTGWHLPVRYASISSDGTISVFIVSGDSSYIKHPRVNSRSYDLKGNALTDMLTGEEVTSVAGYHELLEFLAGREAWKLEYRLRSFLQEDIMGRNFCGSGSVSDVRVAYYMRLASKDERKRTFFTMFCKQKLESCGLARFSELEHKQCAAGDKTD